MANRCHDCDKPLVSTGAFHALPSKCRVNCNGCDACRALCWREWHGGICQAEPVDWRARALAAEAALAETTRELHTLCDAADAVARAVLDAIRAVSLAAMHEAFAAGADERGECSGLLAVRARLLAAGEAAAEGRTR